MVLDTKNFGDIIVKKEKIIIFKEGIPGFEKLREFIIIKEDEVFTFLQSIEDGDICLTLINPFPIFKEYKVELKEEVLATIDGGKEEYIGVYTVVVVAEFIENMTTNLKAPIVVNFQSMKGVQVMLDKDDLEIKTPLFKALKASIDGGKKVC